MDEWDTQQAQLDDADEEGAVLALAEGCAAFRAGVAADDDDVELVGVQTPAERAAASRRRAEAEGKVLEIDDDVEFLGTRQAEQRPVRRHLAEPPRRKSPPPRDTIRTFGGSTAKATGGRCACAESALRGLAVARPWRLGGVPCATRRVRRRRTRGTDYGLRSTERTNRT